MPCHSCHQSGESSEIFSVLCPPIAELSTAESSACRGAVSLADLERSGSNPRLNRRILCLLLLCLLPSLQGGCSDGRPRTWPVRGTVLFEDGSPVKTGVIELESIEHQTTATGKIGEDGSFILGTFREQDGAVAGQHRAIVIQLIMGDRTIVHTQDHGHPVPVHYATYESSDLRLTVEPTADNNLTVILRQK